MTLLDGKATAQTIRTELQHAVAEVAAAGRRPPHLVAILVGNNPASETYIGGKIKACEEVGYRSTLVRYPFTVSEAELLARLDAINKNESLDGVIVQLPLPEHISESKVVEAVLPGKDVDGFHPINIGRMAKGLPALLPATPAGIVELLHRYRIPTSGKHCVVVGRSNIVGSPISILMARNVPKGEVGNATVTLCHSRTTDLAYHTLQADILIVAAGKLELITGDMVKPGAVVVDVGMHRVEAPETKTGFRLKGDVDFASAAERASFITPVPGGVGPMTIAMLLKNTLQAYMAAHT